MLGTVLDCVVVTYSSRSETCVRACVALLKSPSVRTVVVVDNGSTDPDTIASFASEHSDRVRITRFDSNRGSAAGFAEGIRVSFELGAENILIVDDDNILGTDSIESLLQLLRTIANQVSHPFGIICHRDHHPNLRLALRSHCARLGFPTVGAYQTTDIFSFVRRRKISTQEAKNRYTDLPISAREVPYAPYGGLLLTRAAVELGGFPNLDFVLYCDDYDYTSRLISRGGAIYFAPEVSFQDESDAPRPSVGGGPAFLADGIDTPRVFYTVRNLAHFQSSRTGGVTARFRYRVNKAVFFSLALMSCRSFKSFAKLRRLSVVAEMGENALLGLGPELPQ